MADQAGKLSPEDQEKVKEWLAGKWKKGACPFSHDNNWEIGEILAQATALTPGGMVIEGQVYPFVVLTCSGCGYTVFLNAIKLGIVTPRRLEVGDGSK